MKTFKIFAVIAVVVTLSATSIVSIAGKPGRDSEDRAAHEWLADVLNPADMAEVLASHLQGELGLTDEQKAEVLPVLQTHFEEGMGDLKGRRTRIRDNVQTTASERQAMLQEIETQLSGILTEEQMQSLRQMAEDGWGHALDMRSRVAEGDFLNRENFGETLKELNLTLEQKKELFSIAMKYRTIHQDTREEMQGIRMQFATSILDLLNSDEFDEERVRQTYQESAAKLEDVVVSGAKMMLEMKAVLTPEQQEIVQQKSAEFLEQMQNGGMFGRRFGFRDHQSKRHSLFSFRSRHSKK